MRSTIYRLPQELIQSILIRLPVESNTLLSVALASKQLFGYTLLQDPLFARHHFLSTFKSSCPTPEYPSIWEFLDSKKLINQDFQALPFHYKVAIYNEVLSAPRWDKVVDDQEPPPKELDLFDNDRWQVDRETAFKIMKTLLESKFFDINVHASRPFRWACRLGHESVVEMLLQRGLVDPSVDDNHAVECASFQGHLGILNLLLRDSRVDPTSHGDSCVIMAAQEGHLEVVVRLLQIDAVNPGTNGSAALNLAVRYKHADVVECLLQDARVNPAGFEQEAIAAACLSGQADIVRMLLQDERVDPSMEDNYCLVVACENGFDDIVAILLQHPHVDPRVNGGEPLEHSVSKGHLGVVKVLLADSRVFVDSRDHHLSLIAIELGKGEIVEAFLVSGYLDPTFDRYKTIEVAFNHGLFDLVLSLLRFAGFEIDSSVQEARLGAILKEIISKSNEMIE
ncbi:UNVERIFIED_CONTAM: hypothetical protein HDU68_010028 [Siphonaria sp. JEL0065]|nr:hypothetical protein HDU68_010028 [Siphonaria sp. JEL0065]